MQYCSHVGCMCVQFITCCLLVCKLEHLFLVLYLDERVGQVCCVFADPETAIAVKSHLVRLMWSNSPNHGARIVATTLNNPTLYQKW